MVDSPEREEFFTVQEAAEFLGVSRMKLSKLLRDKILTSEINPLDTREKLIMRSQLEKLKGFPPAGKKSGLDDTRS